MVSHKIVAKIFFVIDRCYRLPKASWLLSVVVAILKWADTKTVAEQKFLVEGG